MSAKTDTVTYRVEVVLPKGAGAAAKHIRDNVPDDDLVLFSGPAKDDGTWWMKFDVHPDDQWDAGTLAGRVLDAAGARPLTMEIVRVHS